MFSLARHLLFCCCATASSQCWELVQTKDCFNIRVVWILHKFCLPPCLYVPSTQRCSPCSQLNTQSPWRINKCNTVCYLRAVSLAVFPAGSTASRITNFLIKGNKQAHSSAVCKMQTQQLGARRVCVIFHCWILLLRGFKSSWLDGSHPGRSGEGDFSASGALKSIKHHYFFTGSNVWERLSFRWRCAELSGHRSVFKRHSVWWLPGVKT